MPARTEPGIRFHYRVDKPCLVCGRVRDKPMCYRGEPWCCNRHRKEALRRMAELPVTEG